MLEAESAEWIAIISECMESGVFANLPPPIASKGVNVVVAASLRSFECRFSLCFFFSSARAVVSKDRTGRRPVFKAPPLKPAR